jgi:hypothetical protein
MTSVSGYESELGLVLETYMYVSHIHTQSNGLTLIQT